MSGAAVCCELPRFGRVIWLMKLFGRASGGFGRVEATRNATSNASRSGRLNGAASGRRAGGAQSIAQGCAASCHSAIQPSFAALGQSTPSLLIAAHGPGCHAWRTHNAIYEGQPLASVTFTSANGQAATKYKGHRLTSGRGRLPAAGRRAMCSGRHRRLKSPASASTCSLPGCPASAPPAGEGARLGVGSRVSSGQRR